MAKTKKIKNVNPTGKITGQDIQNVVVDKSLHARSFAGRYEGKRIRGRFSWDGGSVYLCSEEYGLDGGYTDENFGYSCAEEIDVDTLGELMKNKGLKITEIGPAPSIIKGNPFLDKGVFGYMVRKQGGNFTFGCGEVSVPIKTVQEFNELIQGLTPTQLKVINTILPILNEQGLNLDKNTIKNINSLFIDKPYGDE